MSWYNKYYHRRSDRLKSRVQEKDLVPEEFFRCPEDECSGQLRRRWSHKYGRWFYGCDKHFITGCNGGIGCHPNGSPLGIPANAETRKARIEAHKIFDQLWKECHMKRSEAYKFFAKYMELDELHIAQLDKEQCEKLSAGVENYLTFEYNGVVDVFEELESLKLRD
jgi:hypothetical protein